MVRTHNLPSIHSLVSEALGTYKKHVWVYVLLLLIVYALLVPNMIIDISPEGSIETTWRILALFCQAASLYFVVAFVKSVVRAVDGHPPSVRDALPAFSSVIRPVLTLVTLAILSIPIFSFLGVVAASFWQEVTVLTVISGVIILIPVLFICFIITGTFLFSVKYSTWPLRSMRDFWNKTKDAFVPFFLRYAGLFLFMILFTVLIGFLSGLFWRYVSPETLALVVMLVMSIFFLMPLIYFSLVKLLFTDYENHRLPQVQLLELNSPDLSLGDKEN